MGPSLYGRQENGCPAYSNPPQADAGHKKQNRVGAKKDRGAAKIAARLWNQAAQSISTGQLRMLPCFHIRPINLVFFKGLSGGGQALGRSSLGAGFPLRMLSAVILSEHSHPAMPLARQPEHQRFVHSGPLVLGADPRKSPTPAEDRDRTVSRRSKPSSRTSLNGEQPYPWDLLQPPG